MKGKSIIVPTRVASLLIIKFVVGLGRVTTEKVLNMLCKCDHYALSLITKLGIVTPKEERGKKATTEKVTNMLCKCDNYALSIIIILYN